MPFFESFFQKDQSQFATTVAKLMLCIVSTVYDSWCHLALSLLQVYDGALPPQLGSLSRLNNVTISQYCLNGLLPPLLLRGLPELRALLVLPALLKSTYVSPTGEQCGITGPVPMEWQTTKSNITRLELPYHR